MRVSRRQFLGTATGVAATWLPLKARLGAGQVEGNFPDAPGSLSPTRAPILDCVLLDLGADCRLPESLAGYQAALHQARVRFVKIPSGPIPRCRKVIVPGCTVMGVDVARRLSTLLEEGSGVLIESGAGFADPATFTAHQEFLSSHFGLEVEPPIGLWGSSEGSQRVPYVDFTWPSPKKIRDFSRVVPSSRTSGDVICGVDGLVVAVKRRVGKGTLIFLGSPLGPSLLAGDLEARRWLGELVAGG